MTKSLIKLKPNLLASLTGVILCAVSGITSATTTLVFNDHAPLASFPSTGASTVSGVYTVAFGTTIGGGNNPNPEFRVVTAGGAVSGGGEKSIVSTAKAETWIFADDVNLTSVLNTDITIGTDGSQPVPLSPVAPAGDVGLFSNAIFLGSPFGFLAPTVGSAAGDFYGNGTISVDVNCKSMQVFFPVLEAQWGQGFFPLGQVDDGFHGTGITFTGNLTNILLNTPSAGLATFDFIITAEHIIQADEDDLGFEGQTTQWELAGSGVAPLTSLNSPTVAAGTIAATIPGTVTNDGRVCPAEVNSPSFYNAPVDDEVASSCEGTCFAFTTTGFTGGSAIVTLPLSTRIPGNAVYRKLIDGGWRNFDTSTGDRIESADGAPGDCSGVLSYRQGLKEGDFCVRLTISDGGPNDGDGVASADGTIIDPGGVGVFKGEVVSLLIPGQSLDDADGCSISNKPVAMHEKMDWLIVFAFITLLGLMRRKKMN